MVWIAAKSIVHQHRRIRWPWTIFSIWLKEFSMIRALWAEPYTNVLRLGYPKPDWQPLGNVQGSCWDLLHYYYQKQGPCFTDGGWKATKWAFRASCGCWRTGGANDAIWAAFRYCVLRFGTRPSFFGAEVDVGDPDAYIRCSSVSVCWSALARLFSTGMIDLCCTS